MKTPNCIVVACLLAASTSAKAQSLNSSDVWYADLLRQHFPVTIRSGTSSYALSEISTTPVDITRFEVTVDRQGSVVSVQGSVVMRALPDGFSVFDGANGRRYMLHLNGFIFGPSGNMLWEQHGFPQRGAWTRADGETRQFALVGNGRVPIPRGSTLVILASGDPIFGPTAGVTRVILGAKTLRL